MSIYALYRQGRSSYHFLHCQVKGHQVSLEDQNVEFLWGALLHMYKTMLHWHLILQTAQNLLWFWQVEKDSHWVWPRTSSASAQHLTRSLRFPVVFVVVKNLTKRSRYKLLHTHETVTPAAFCPRNHIYLINKTDLKWYYDQIVTPWFFLVYHKEFHEERIKTPLTPFANICISSGDIFLVPTQLISTC